MRRFLSVMSTMIVREGKDTKFLRRGLFEKEYNEWFVFGNNTNFYNWG